LQYVLSFKFMARFGVCAQNILKDSTCSAHKVVVTIRHRVIVKVWQIVPAAGSHSHKPALNTKLMSQL